MEKLLWLDGHTSSISEKESYDKICIEYRDGSERFILSYNGLEFEWHNNMWMQR